MILVDTSVWVDHFRSPVKELAAFLVDGQVAMHRFVLGELALGNMKNRQETLALLSTLYEVDHASDVEVFDFIESQKLFGLGIGFVDAHLLASAKLSRMKLWSRDKRLSKLAGRFGLYEQ